MACRPESRSPRSIALLRWIARVWSIASLGLILAFFIGEGFSPAQVSVKEWLGLLFFPVGVVAGMVVAWRHEGWGGGIATASLLAFYGVYGYLLNGAFPRGWAFAAIGAPGVLFLVTWLVERYRRP